jgi:quinol monooxygenase YgiN
MAGPSRRTVISGAAGAMLAAPVAASESGYGMIGKITATAGRGRDLAALLMAGAGGMPGCRAYLVALDAANPDVVWVTETWDSKAAHAASLKLPAVQAAIRKARPIMAGFETVAELNPLGDAAPR